MSINNIKMFIHIKADSSTKQHQINILTKLDKNRSLTFRLDSLLFSFYIIQMKASVRTVKGKQTTYMIGELLGQGQFGRVYKGHPADHTESVAIKIIRKSKFIKNQKLKYLLEREMLILTEFTHENVIKLLEMVVEKQEVYIIYEYCEGGTLEDRIPLPEKDIQHIFLQMVDALLEAEEKGIIHRDLKPANILFKEKKLKIADWGFSRLLQNGETTSSFIGSPAYMAPEILRGEEYTLKADVWSLGVAIYETLTGSCPWKSNNISSLCHEIKKTKISFPPELNLADFWKNIITEMLSPSPSNRPTCRELKLKFSKSVKIPKSVDQLEQQKIMSCVFFLQIVQWSRKNLLNLSKFDFCLKLIDKNLLKLKYSSQEQTQLLTILEKQIKVVNSLKRKIQLQLNSKRKHFNCSKLESLRTRQSEQNPEGEWQEIIKQTVKYVIDDLQLIYKDKESLDEKEHKLVQLNILLDLIIFEQIPKEYLQKTFQNYLKELQTYNKKNLLKLINYKLQIINKKYYQ